MNFKIPLFELNFDEQEEQAVVETLRSKWISTGPRTAEFESIFARMLNINHAVALSNCTVALHLAMKILNIGPGDEVICPSLTFVATVNAIRHVDAIPVFADISSLHDLTIDPEDIERKITARTKAIVVMHYGGFACNMDRIMKIAKDHNLKVIEDACHGPLAEYKGAKLGTIGDVGCFSFFSNKNISIGEGGMIVTNNPQHFEKLKLLRSHGMTSLSYDRSKGHSAGYDVVELGYNYRMDDIRSSIGIVQLKKLENDLKSRLVLRKYYEEKLASVSGLLLPFTGYKYFSSNYIFPIILLGSTSENRDLIRFKLADAGIQTSSHYPSVHKFSIYKQFDTKLEKTEYVSDNLISLPFFAGLKMADIDYIADVLSKLIS